MHLDDNAQQPIRGRSTDSHEQPSLWRRWIANLTGSSAPARPVDPATAEMLSVHATLRALPALLDGSQLPNGVVELLIEELEEPTRRLFDIHDGTVTLVEPGTAVPWACIAGSTTAWALALGRQHTTSELRVTGDEQLARRVLAALPRRA